MTSLAQQWAILVIVCVALIISITFPFIYPRYAEMEFFLQHHNKLPGLQVESEKRNINKSFYHQQAEIHHISTMHYQQRHEQEKARRYAMQCRPIPQSIQEIQRSFKIPSDTDLALPQKPNLLLIAPPKSGTTSFINALSRYPNIVQYGDEHHYFNHKCSVINDKSLWTSFFQIYGFFQIKSVNLSDILQEFMRCDSNIRDSIKQYHLEWDKTYQDHLENSKPCWSNKQCLYPLESNNDGNINNDNNYCYLIEKAPNYSKHPWISILYAYKLPKVKVVNIIRDPADHLLSAFYAFYPIYWDRKDISFAMNQIVQDLNDLALFQRYRKLCEKLNVKWNSLQRNSSQDRYLKMTNSYRSFMADFMSSKYGRSELQNSSIYEWSAFVFPTILTAILVYDETDSNNYKVISFEWMYNNLPNAMKQIYCWMMDIDDSIKCDSLIDDDINIKLFEELGKPNHMSPISTPSDRQSDVYQQYKQQINDLFQPCHTAMTNLFHDRNSIIFGQFT